jgi:hypothetical protein
MASLLLYRHAMCIGRLKQMASYDLNFDAAAKSGSSTRK